MPSRSRSRETLIGAVVVAAGALLVVATTINRHEGAVPSGLYEVTALFNRADGIGVGSEVRLAGIPVGKVVGHTLADGYRALVTMRLDVTEDLPDDTAAVIHTEGFLGGKYIELRTGGGGMGTIPSGERLDYTQDSVVMEDLLAKVVAMAKTRRGLDPNRPAAPQVQEQEQARRAAQDKARQEERARKLEEERQQEEARLAREREVASPSPEAPASLPASSESLPAPAATEGN